MSESSKGGMTLSSVGFIVWIVFLVLKLCEVLPESFTWFWVWFPLWIGPAIALVLYLLAFLFALIVGWLD